MGVAPNLFVRMVYVAPIGSKHESESLFQNLGANIVEVQTLGSIVLLKRDFNARIITIMPVCMASCITADYGHAHHAF
jgi:hypothetical protein